MDHLKLDNKSDNPRKRANIFSILTFFYNVPLLKKGKVDDLTENDVYNVLPSLSAGNLGNSFERQWESEKKNYKNPKLWRCLAKSFGLIYCLYGIIELGFGMLIIYIKPLVFSKFVACFASGQTQYSGVDALSFAAGIVGVDLLNTIFKANFAQLVTEYIIKVRTSTCSLIYRKALKISPLEFSEISIGKIVTLLAKDVFSIDGSLAFLKDCVVGLLYLVFVTYVLYNKVGFSAFPAIGVIFIMIPFQLFLGKKTAINRIKAAKKTDERFRLIQEILSAVKIIKMYTWELFFEKSIHKARLKETKRLKIVYYLKSLIVIFGASTIFISFYILLVSYIARGYTIEAATLYFIQESLLTVRHYIGTFIPLGIAQTADMIGAIRRIQEFLDAKEFKRDNEQPTSKPSIYLNEIGVKIGKKEILKSVSLDIQEGLVVLTGQIGSGKSAFLKTILGEYPICHGEKKVSGTLSYATEEPWLFTSTIRQNILFGQNFDADRYRRVLHVCALTYDINQFEKGDNTIVGDKGINLSKGQQARITLARAIYRDCDIYLLDDCLYPLDNQVNKHIFERCIKGFLQNKICIVVTNNISNIRSVPTSNILYIENGETLTLIQQSGALDKRITYFIDEETEPLKRWSEYITDNVANEDKGYETDMLLAPAKPLELKENLYYEENKQGGVLWKNYVTYFRLIGGFLTIFVFCIIYPLSQFCVSYSEKLISSWVNLEPTITNLTKHNLTNTSEYLDAMANREKYLNMYTMTILGILVFFTIRAFFTFFFCMNAAKKLHKAVISAILNTHMYFFDNHFIGNIINRLSKDFHTIDEYMPFLVLECLRSLCAIAGTVLLVASVNLWFFIPAGLLFIKLYFIQKFYLPSGRSLRRLESATRSPIIGYLNSTLGGLMVARASQKEDLLKSEFDRHQDLYTSVFYMNQTTSRFFSLLCDVMGMFFVFGIMVKIILFRQNIQAGDVGLAISQALALSGFLQYVIRSLTEIENVMTSIERVSEYSDADRERKSGQVLKRWPLKGHISYSDVSLTYKSDGNRVLKDLTFEIEGQSKIGIVGRTGAGKSSIISTLFRLYQYEGTISIDGEDIETLNLDFLRSSISIIPQDPIIFSGSIRSNIDPMQKYTDTEIWSVLEKVHVKSLISDLHQTMTNSNYSSGQKQLFCLARSLIQNNKIVVLDEATATLDRETDHLLQVTVKESLQNCTVIIIAHRLHSIMHCDKVLVMDAGRIVEFDKPQTLLENKNGSLYKMVQEEGFSHQ